MSANEHNDWNDSLDFESLADEHDDYGAPGTGDVVDEDLADDLGEDMDVFDEPLVEDVTDPEPEAARPSRGRARSTGGVSGAGLGVLFAFSILVAAIGSGGALMTALGVDPASLWQPEGLSQIDQLLNLERNPLNLVYIVLLATMLLTLLGAWAISRAVRRAGDRARHNAHLLDLVCDLRIDEERGWQSHDLKNHPGLATFVEENVGTWRLFEARQRRASGLEGELQRLAKAAAADKSEDLRGHFDHPAVGALADELLRQIEARNTAQREAEAIRAKDREEAEVIIRAVTEAAGWNLGFTDQVGVQNAAATGIVSRLRDLEATLGQGEDNHIEEVREALDHLRHEIHDSTNGASADDVVSELHEHVERGTKLAFQIAMEVARLGQRGERLLPMTQALEELATNFRKTAERLGDPEHDGPSPQERWERHLLALQDRLGESGGSRLDSIRQAVQDVLPVVDDLGGRLGALAGGADQQTDRLRDLGRACAALTGVEFDPDRLSPPPAEPSASNDLGLTRFDPFSGEAEDDFTLQVDPFATGEPDDVDTADTVHEVALDEPAPPAPFPATTPEPPLVLDETPAPTPTPPAAPAVEPRVVADDPGPAAPVPPAPVVEPAPVPPVTPPVAPTAAAPVSEVPVEPRVVADTPPAVEIPEIPGEAVYDLDDLGGTRMEDTPAAAPETPAAGPAEPSEPIYDLSEFGAVRLG
jgi:hypothetical protein